MPVVLSDYQRKIFTFCGSLELPTPGPLLTRTSDLGRPSLPFTNLTAHRHYHLFIRLVCSHFFNTTQPLPRSIMMKFPSHSQFPLESHRAYFGTDEGLSFLGCLIMDQPNLHFCHAMQRTSANIMKNRNMIISSIALIQTFSILTFAISHRVRAFPCVTLMITVPGINDIVSASLSGCDGHDMSCEFCALFPERSGKPAPSWHPTVASKNQV